MNEQNNGKKTLISEYFAAIFVILVTLFCVLLSYFMFNKTTGYPDAVNWNYAFSLGGILALGYQLIFIISGGWSRAFKVFIERWAEFFSDLTISFKLAISSLIDSIINDGVLLILHLGVFLSTLYMCVTGCQYLITLYGL